MGKDVVYIIQWNVSHKDKIMPFATTWMGLEAIMLSEISQRQVLYDFTYIWDLKNRTNEKTKQKRNRLIQKTNCWLPERWRGLREEDYRIENIVNNFIITLNSDRW